MRNENEPIQHRHSGELELVTHARRAVARFEPVVVPHAPEWTPHLLVAEHPRPVVLRDAHAQTPSSAEMPRLPRHLVAETEHAAREPLHDALVRIASRREMYAHVEREVEAPLRRRRDPRLEPDSRYRVCGNPRSTFDVAGSGQREVTTLPRV